MDIYRSFFFCLPEWIDIEDLARHNWQMKDNEKWHTLALLDIYSYIYKQEQNLSR